MSGGLAGGLDHVGLAGTSLDSLAETFERLGFTLTPLARHVIRAAPDQPAQIKPTGNRCIMLAAGYVELLALVDPAGHSPTLAAMLARHGGLHVLALAITDEAAALARLHRAGVTAAAFVAGERAQARFSTLTADDASEGRWLLIHHLTPEALRPARFLGHANHAVALQEVIIAHEAPAAAAARLSRLAGLPVVPDPLGGYVLPMAQGRVRLLPPAAVATLFPGATPPCLPWIAGLVLATDDNNAALRRRLAYWQIAQAAGPEGLVVEGGGAFLCFRGG